MLVPGSCLCRGSGYRLVVFVAAYKGHAATTVIARMEWILDVRAVIITVNQQVCPGYDQETRHTVGGVNASALRPSPRMNFQATK